MQSAHGAINMAGIEEWEKQAILKVLNRNNKVMEHEERRLQQLAVRTQLSRMTDSSSSATDLIVKTKTGSWMKDLCQHSGSRNVSVEVRRAIYRSMGMKSPTKLALFDSRTTPKSSEPPQDTIKEDIYTSSSSSEDEEDCRDNNDNIYNKQDAFSKITPKLRTWSDYANHGVRQNGVSVPEWTNDHHHGKCK